MFGATLRCTLAKALKKNCKAETFKLILSERPFKILQNETTIIKIRQALLKIFNFQDQDLDSFPRKRQKNQKCCLLEVLHKLKNIGLCDVRNDKCTIKQ